MQPLDWRRAVLIGYDSEQILRLFRLRRIALLSVKTEELHLMTNSQLLADCHTHIDDYPAIEMPDILQRAQDAGVRFIVVAGTTMESTRKCIQMTQQYEMLYAGVGIHPMNARERIDEGTYTDLKAMAEGCDKVVCISEIGLDFLPDSPDHEVQYQVFREQIRLARELKLPIIFHSRESHPEVFQTLREERAGDVGGVMHYFPSRRGNGKGCHRLRVLHFVGPSAATASRVAGDGQEHSVGQHCPGDRCGAPALQEVPAQLDGASPRADGGPEAGRDQGSQRG